ncbi:hypothetical protein Prudu_755S000300 [Prunus dulcis]|uniref:Uncharacterized protein n=1 Tax=Prunus dulcis TaxID=3755 RepID=A0A5H2XQS6_PRUDU|nr:hypothetical protein Prudu_755S000300 [Prunus dulcis]
MSKYVQHGCFIDPATPSLDLADVRAKRETVYFLDPLPEIVWSMKRQKHREQHTKATQQCRMRVLCDALHEDIIMDPSLAFEKKYAKGKQEAIPPRSN